jgi:adenine-specific DNA-methyltransferase
MNNKNKSKEGKYGQFFTVSEMCDDVLNIVDNIKEIGGDLLEPSFGSGNFIDSIVNNEYKFNSIDAVEIDTENFLKYKNSNKNINLYNLDFMKFNSDKKYDFIVGNPPYIELCYSFYDDVDQKEIRAKYKGISNGRVNLVHIFMRESFNMIKDDGVIAYLLPSSILTSPVYKGIRKEIFDNFDVVYLDEDTKFGGVAIKVCLLIIRKIKNTGKYIYLNNDNYFIMKDYDKFECTKTLKDYNFSVNIGDIIWNNNKEKLSNVDCDKILIYSSNIKYNSLELLNNKRPQYIIDSLVRYKNCVVFPRTISKKINFHYIENNKKYVFENHTIIVSHEDKHKLDLFYKNLKNGLYDVLLNSFFNSSNLTKSELLSLPFIE